LDMRSPNRPLQRRAHARLGLSKPRLRHRTTLRRNLNWPTPCRYGNCAGWRRCGARPTRGERPDCRRRGRIGWNTASSAAWNVALCGGARRRPNNGNASWSSAASGRRRGGRGSRRVAGCWTQPRLLRHRRRTQPRKDPRRRDGFRLGPPPMDRSIHVQCARQHRPTIKCSACRSPGCNVSSGGGSSGWTGSGCRRPGRRRHEAPGRLRSAVKGCAAPAVKTAGRAESGLPGPF
jgi:hypothetical protein